MKRHLAALGFVALAGAISSTASAQQALTPDQLVGAWKFQSGVTHNATTGADTPVSYSAGFLTYVPVGKTLRLSVNLAGLDRKEAAPTATDAEAVQLFKSYNAYSGIVELGATATTEGTPVTTNIDVNLNQSILGKYPRTYRVDGTKLTVIIKSSADVTSTSVWEKVQ